MPAADSDRVRLFCEKLQEKKQSKAQLELADHAILLKATVVEKTLAACSGAEHPLAEDEKQCPENTETGP